MLKWMRAERTPKQRLINIFFLFILIILLTIASAKVNMKIDEITAEQAKQAAELVNEQITVTPEGSDAAQ